jgi:hypothetical protein
VIVFGLILVLLALAAGVVLFLATQSLTNPVNLELAGYHWGMTPLALLITGAVAMLLFWFGLGMIRGSAKRRRRPIREAKDAERQAQLEESIRADERARAEETHQGALAERDRIHGEELQTRLAERDRERDDESRTREREIEDRVRAEERTKLEREFAGRQSSATGAPVAGAAAGVGAGAGAGAGAAYAAREHSSRADDGSADERVYARDDATREDLTPGPATRDDARDEVGRDGTAGAHAVDNGTSVDENGSVDDENGAVHDQHRPVYRTVADKLMGRDPERRG